MTTSFADGRLTANTIDVGYSCTAVPLDMSQLFLSAGDRRQSLCVR
jgi:hypothetical protein